MNKPITIWVACCILWIGCGENTEEEKTETVSPKKGETNNLPKEKLTKDGPYQEFYPDGQLKIEGTMSAGNKEGEWKSFYPNGGNYSVTNYAGGKLNGKTVTYYKNGKIRYIGYYTDSKPSGKWLVFNDEGEQVSEKEYKE